MMILHLILMALIAFITSTVMSFVAKRFAIVKHRKDQKDDRLRVACVLGSGGHTGEMIQLLQQFDFEKKCSGLAIIADTDVTSLNRLKASSVPIDLFDKATIPRAREVGQRQMLIWLVEPRIFSHFQLLVNGPGTCLPVAVLTYVLQKVSLIPPCKIMFVESLCRTQTLSLTGKILYKFADEFVVQWPSLKEKFPKAKYLGTIF